MLKQEKLDGLYLGIAIGVGQKMSYAQRAKVGSVIVKNDNIISMGWNGMPAGMDNECEIHTNGQSVTNPLVLHAESNAIMKLAKSGGIGAENATLYCSLSPCVECAKLIKQAGITRVVYNTPYRMIDGVEILRSLGVEISQLDVI